VQQESRDPREPTGATGPTGPAFYNGNMVLVDKIYGSDTLGQRNGRPFLTIGAALAVAQGTDVVYVYPGFYNESVTIPSGVELAGISSDRCYI
jgi:hypothetical protein